MTKSPFGDGRDGVLDCPGEVVTLTRNVQFASVAPGTRVRLNGWSMSIRDTSVVSSMDGDVITFGSAHVYERTGEPVTVPAGTEIIGDVTPDCEENP